MFLYRFFHKLEEDTFAVSHLFAYQFSVGGDEEIGRVGFHTEAGNDAFPDRLALAYRSGNVGRVCHPRSTLSV